jgi:hypothetical protein
VGKHREVGIEPAQHSGLVAVRIAGSSGSLQRLTTGLGFERATATAFNPPRTRSRSNVPTGLCSSPAILVNAVLSAEAMRKVSVSALADDVVRGMATRLVIRNTTAACNRCLSPL